MQRVQALTNRRPSPAATRRAASSASPTSLFLTTTKRKNSFGTTKQKPRTCGAFAFDAVPAYCLLLIAYCLSLIAYRSEAERHSATHRARRLHQVQRLPVAADHRN